MPKTGSVIIHRRVYQRFSEHSFVEHIQKVNWDLVIECNDTETALPIFAKLFSNICDKYVPIKKHNVRKIKSPWLNDELKKYQRVRFTEVVCGDIWLPWRLARVLSS